MMLSDLVLTDRLLRDCLDEFDWALRSDGEFPLRRSSLIVTDGHAPSRPHQVLALENPDVSV
jgi:hypothetical protein